MEITAGGMTPLRKKAGGEIVWQTQSWSLGIIFGYADGNIYSNPKHEIRNPKQNLGDSVQALRLNHLGI